MSDKSDKLAIRLIAIITKLNSGEKFTVRELAEEFATSEKTITTDLNKRLNQFLPIIRDKNYYYMESYAIGKLGFNDIRNFAKLSGIKELYPTLEDDLLADVLNAKINDSCLVKDGKYENLSNKVEEFKIVRLAITLKHTLTFIYNDKSRVVNPYKLVNNDNIWYLVGDENNKLKTYSFSKISNLSKTENSYLSNSEFVKIINKNEANWFSQDNISVILKIDSKVTDYFLKRKLLANQTILKHTDKALILKTIVSYDEEILRVVRYWMPHIKIIEPEYLQEKLINKLDTYIKECKKN